LNQGTDVLYLFSNVLYPIRAFTDLGKEDHMAKKKVFVSFDFDNDKILKDFIIGQSKLDDSPFEVTDFSLKEAAPEKDWLAKARSAIARSEVFIVMLGSKTKNASGVLKEIKLANELKKTKFQIIGYKDGSEDWAVPDAGRVYRWNWDNLKKLLS
jgi:hypothetical protein